MGRQLDEKNMELKSLEKFKGKLSTKSTDGKEGVDEEEMEGLLSEDGEDDEDEAVEADEAGGDDETDEAGEDEADEAVEDGADDVEEAKPCSEDISMLNQMTSPEVADDLATHLTKPCRRYIGSLEHDKDDYIAEHGPNFKMSGLFKDVYKFDVTELKKAEKEAPGKVRRGAQAFNDVQRQIKTGKPPAGREVDHRGSPPSSRRRSTHSSGLGLQSDTFPYERFVTVEYYSKRRSRWQSAIVLSDTFNTDGTIQLDIQPRANPNNVRPQRTDTLIYNEHDWMEDDYPINIVGRTEKGWLFEYVNDEDIPSWAEDERQFESMNNSLYIEGEKHLHPDNFKWRDHY